MARKTIHIAQFCEYVNNSLRLSTESPDTRQGKINLLEAMLHLTDNYNGYNYLTQDEVPEGQLPGIRHDVEDKFHNTDKTRVRYY